MSYERLVRWGCTVKFFKLDWIFLFADIKMLAVHKAGQVARLCAVLPKTQVQQIYRYRYQVGTVRYLLNYRYLNIFTENARQISKGSDAAPWKFGWIFFPTRDFAYFFNRVPWSNKFIRAYTSFAFYMYMFKCFWPKSARIHPRVTVNVHVSARISPGRYRYHMEEVRYQNIRSH